MYCGAHHNNILCIQNIHVFLMGILYYNLLHVHRLMLGKTTVYSLFQLVVVLVYKHE